MTTTGRGPIAKGDPDAELRRRLVERFRWRADRTDPWRLADTTGWWADPTLLRGIGPALAGLFEPMTADATPTVVVGPRSSGSLLGALVAVQLGVGLVEVHKDPAPSADSDRWLTCLTPPDYRDRTLKLGIRSARIGAGDRVLFVDDWIDTGSQALATRSLVHHAGARWLGAAVVVDALEQPRLRHDLDVRALLHRRDL